MLSASLALRRRMAENTKAEIRAELALADGTTVELTGADLALGGLSITQATSGIGGFEVGAAIVGTCEITLANYDGRFDDYDFTGATVVPQVGAELTDGTTEWLRKGVYGIEQPDSYGSTISLRCLDNLRLMQRPYSDVATAYPATLQVIVANICTACGVQLRTTQFPNCQYLVDGRPTDPNITCLEVLGYAVQVAGCFARCDEYGRLAVSWYSEPEEGEDWPEGANATAEALTSLKVATDDVVVTGVRVTASRQVVDGGMGAEGETETYGLAGYVLAISDNPLIEYGRAAQVAAQVGAACVGMRFRPFDASGIASPAWEAGDHIVVIDQMGRRYASWLTSYTWRAGGHAAMACTAETPARNSAAGASARTAALVEMRNAIRAERTSREVAVSNLAAQLAGSSGLYKTEEIQQDDSTVYYLHDKPALGDSTIVWKLTSSAFGVSVDGGETYPFGFDAWGNAILSAIYAIGIDAQYITAGYLGDPSGKTFWNLVSGIMRIVGTSTNAKSQHDTMEFGTLTMTELTGWLNLITTQQTFAGLVLGSAASGSATSDKRLAIIPTMAQKVIGTTTYTTYPSAIISQSGLKLLSHGFASGTRTGLALMGTWAELNVIKASGTVDPGIIVMDGKVYLAARRNQYTVTPTSPLPTTEYTIAVSGVGTSGSTHVQGTLNISGPVDATDTNAGRVYVGSSVGKTGNVLIRGTFTVSGTKSRVAETEDYGERLLYCYETPSPTFGDLGSGTIGEDGTAVVSIDPVFAETARTDLAYQVFLQKCGPGDLWVSGKEPTHFIVEGTPGLAFDWEVKAHQAGYEAERLDDREVVEAAREGSDTSREAEGIEAAYADELREAELIESLLMEDLPRKEQE